MANYDAEIRVNTKVDTAQMQRLEVKIEKAEIKADALAKKYDELRNKKIPTDEYKEIADQIAKAETEFNKLLEKQDEMIALGKTSGATWDRIQYKLEQTGNTIRYAKGELQDLIDSGKAFRIGAGTEEIEKTGQQLSVARNELRALNTQYDELCAKQLKSSNATKKSTKEFKKMEKTGKKSLNTIQKGTSKTSNALSAFGSRLKSIALSLFVFNWITKGFNAMVSGMKEGYQNLCKYSNEYNRSASELKSANTQLKNSFATEIAPVINALIPYLVKFLNMVTKCTNGVAQFMAVLSGKKTWTKAKEVQEDYAGSLDGTNDSAENLQKTLAGFDKLEVLGAQEKSSKGSGSDVSDMFEEVEIDQDVLNTFDKIIAKAEELKETFKEGFKEGFEFDNFEELKESAESIKKSLISIYNNPKLTKARNNFYNSLAKNTGKAVGAGTSIGYSVATGVMGGYEDYLSKPENQDFLVDKLSGTYENLSDITDSAGDFAEALAEIATAFESEAFQDIAEFFIDVFTTRAVSNIEKVTGFLGDIVDCFTRPVNQNSEDFKGLLEDTFELAEKLISPLQQLWDVVKENDENWEESWLHKMLQFLADGNTKTTKEWIDSARDAIQNASAAVDDFNESCGVVISRAKTVKDNIDKLVDAFTKAKEEGESTKDALKSAFDELPENAKRGINGLIQNVEDMLNNIIDGINDIFDELLGFNVNIPGYGKIGMDIPDIPKINLPELKDGTVIQGGRPFAAILGDQRFGQTNIETPLPTMIKAFRQALAEQGMYGGGNYTFVAQLDGKTIFKEQIKQNELYKKSTGKSAFV